MNVQFVEVWMKGMAIEFELKWFINKIIHEKNDIKFSSGCFPLVRNVGGDEECMPFMRSAPAEEPVRPASCGKLSICTRGKLKIVHVSVHVVTYK